MASSENYSGENLSSEVTIDLVPLVKKAFRHWPLLVVAFVTFLVLGFAAGLAMTPQYTIQFTIAPKSEVPGAASSGSSIGGGSSSALSLLGSLTSSGTSSTPPSDFEQYRRLMISHAIAGVIVAHPEIMHQLIPGWDEQTKSWAKPSNPIFWLKESVKALLGRPLWSPPSVEDVFNTLKQKLDLEDSLTPGFVDGTIKDQDPKFAVRLLYFLHSTVQEMVKSSKRQDARERIKYLDDQLQTVGVAGQREVLIALLAQEQQKLMLIEADKDFVAQILDPPLIPRSPSSLSPTSMALLAGFVAVFIMMLVVAFTSEEKLHGWRQGLRVKTIGRLPGLRYR